MPSVATFRGKHNHTKAAILMLLCDIKSVGEKEGLALRQLMNMAGYVTMSEYMLSEFLLNNTKWRYINRHGERYHYRYRIAPRGVHFVVDRIPPELYPIIDIEIEDRLIKAEQEAGRFMKGYVQTI
jgi:hypothetical protein